MANNKLAHVSALHLSTFISLLHLKGINRKRCCGSGVLAGSGGGSMPTRERGMVLRRGRGVVSWWRLPLHEGTHMVLAAAFVWRERERRRLELPWPWAPAPFSQQPCVAPFVHPIFTATLLLSSRAPDSRCPSRPFVQSYLGLCATCTQVDCHGASAAPPYLSGCSHVSSYASPTHALRPHASRPSLCRTLCSSSCGPISGRFVL